jgi:hypothetical protein
MGLRCRASVKGTREGAARAGPSLHHARHSRQPQHHAVAAPHGCAAKEPAPAEWERGLVGTRGARSTYKRASEESGGEREHVREGEGRGWRRRSLGGRRGVRVVV